MKEWTDYDNVSHFRSEDYNWNLDNNTGYFERWGKTKEHDALYSPYGPEILDLEATTVCNGKCEICYKSNTPAGKNLSYDDFIEIIHVMNPYNNLKQVAFGLGATGTENPDLWKMCEYLRKNNITPNATFANISEETADNIKKYMGACAISFHNNFEDPFNLLANQIKMLHDRNFKQVNIHFTICKETLGDLYNLVAMTKNDERLIGLNALVLLGLKVCGRAKVNDMRPLAYSQFEDMVKKLIGAGINLGFDSCQGPSVIKVFRNLNKNIPQEKIDKIVQMIEPCESFGLFSSYVDVNGIYSPCSFCAGIKDTVHFNVLKSTPEEFAEFWKNDPALCKLRDKSLAGDRECLYYKLHSDEDNVNVKQIGEKVDG